MARGTIRLAFLADVQIGCMATFSGSDDSDVERFARRGMSVRRFPRTDSLDWDLDRFRAAVDALNEIRPDLAVIGGDMVDDIARPEQYDAFTEVASSYRGPLHYAPGNHDIAADAAVPTTAAVEWYRSHFGDVHGTLTAPVSGDSQLTVLLVNSPVLDQPHRMPGAFEAEMAWIENQLAGRARGPAVVVCHHPPFVEGPGEGRSYWNLPIERRMPFLELLAAAGVELLLCGHRHLNARVEFEGMEIVTTSAVGFPLGADPPGFRVVEIAESGISHTYYPLADPAWEAIGGPPVGTTD